MLALCQHNGATYYAQNYAGIIGASLLQTQKVEFETKRLLERQEGNWETKCHYRDKAIREKKTIRETKMPLGKQKVLYSGLFVSYWPFCLPNGLFVSVVAFFVFPIAFCLPNGLFVSLMAFLSLWPFCLPNGLFVSIMAFLSP